MSVGYILRLHRRTVILLSFLTNSLKERFSIPPRFLPFSDSAEMEHWVKMVFRFLPRNIPTREQ